MKDNLPSNEFISSLEEAPTLTSPENSGDEQMDLCLNNESNSDYYLFNIEFQKDYKKKKSHSLSHIV